jgi:hypothetical protein
MIKEAIDRILSLAPATRYDIGKLIYTDRPLALLKGPLTQTVEVSTLDGFTRLIEAGMDDLTDQNLFVHVVTPTQIELVDLRSDLTGQRQIWIRADYSKVFKFPFGIWTDAEPFTIALQSMFQVARIDGKKTDDLEYVIKMASSVSASEALTLADDGISQHVATAKGIALKDHTTLKNRVVLAPYRTFPEVDQPLSSFVFRVKEDSGRILFALFEADGGRWRIDAMETLKNYLQTKLIIPIVA